MFEFLKTLFGHSKKSDLKNNTLLSDGANQNPIFSLNIGSKAQFMTDYKNIVSNISDPSGIANLRINRNVSDKEFFIVELTYFDETISLVYSTKNFYLLGFIEKTNTFYYFTDTTLTTIPRSNHSKSLGYPGSYIQLGMPGVFTVANIASYITTLQSFDGSKPVNLKKPLSTIIFATAEAFRFKSVAKKLYEIIESSNSMNSATYEDDVKNWASLSAQALQGKAEVIKKINVAKKF